MSRTSAVATGGEFRASTSRRTDAYVSDHRRPFYDHHDLGPSLDLGLSFPRHDLGNALDRVVHGRMTSCVLHRPDRHRVSLEHLFRLHVVFRGRCDRSQHGCYGDLAAARRIEKT